MEGMRMSEAGHILVIDDDHAVRSTICENLRDFGYKVTEASNGEEGIATIVQDGAPDLVITDIIMPKKEGLETIIEIRSRFPEVKLLAISGGGRVKVGDFLGMAEKLGCNASLQKPLNMVQLEKTVEKLLHDT
jgi:CheY-like chemotaxis protein